MISVEEPLLVDAQFSSWESVASPNACFATMSTGEYLFCHVLHTYFRMPENA